MTVAVRDRTRAERYAEKLAAGPLWAPVSLVTVEFHSDNNLGSALRAAACLGAPIVHVIGSVSRHDELMRTSGSTQDLVTLITHRDPDAFLAWRREHTPRSTLVAAELSEASQSLWNYRFDFSSWTYLAIGNETSGVPGVILERADAIVHIPMPGPGFCLNAAASCNVFLAEVSRQLSQWDCVNSPVMAYDRAMFK